MSRLGSHNSWSFNKVKKLWMNVIIWAAKCQDKTIQEQYNAGARCFDLRVRFAKDGSIIVAHGPVQYSITEEQLFDDLTFLDQKKDCCVRVLHEIRNKCKQTQIELERFKKFCSNLTKFSNIYFFCGRNLFDWNIDYEFPTKELTTEDWYGSVKSKWYGKIWPWLWIKLNPCPYSIYTCNKDVLLLDFV